MKTTIPRMKRAYAIFFGLLHGAAILTSAAEMIVEATKTLPDGTCWKVIRESSIFTPPPTETTSQTNAKTGAIATAGRPPGPCRKDVYSPVAEVSGVSKTNQELAMTIVLHTSIPSMKVRDFIIESNAAVYLCESFFAAKVTGQPALVAMVVAPASETNELPKMDGQPIWNAPFGSHSDVKNVKMSGSIDKGTLAIELVSIAGKYSTAQTNYYQHGKWVISMGQPQSTAAESSR